MMRKFYTESCYIHDNGLYYITLDGTITKTPMRHTLYAPNTLLAQAICDEWNKQDKIIAPHTMPLTQIATTIIDHVASRPNHLDGMLQDFALNDVLFYTVATSQGRPDTVKHYEEKRQRYLKKAETFFNIYFNSANTAIIAQPPKQHDAWLMISYNFYHHLPLWPYGLLCQLVNVTQSFIISTMLLQQKISLDDAHDIAEHEYYINIDKWGDDSSLTQQLLDKKQQLQDIMTYHHLYSSPTI